ncbi:MAG TPA: hypothetical protein VGG33_09980 [Polyangia bacterium]
MKYFFAKLALVLLCSVFIVIGLGFITTGLTSGKPLVAVPFGGVFVLIGTGVLITRYRQITRFQTMTYDWYRTTHPANVQGNRLSCFSCGATRINARALMNRTFHREHFCVQCGTALYYSPE